MGSLIDDEILDEFAVVAPVARGREEGPRALRRRDRPRPGRLPPHVGSTTVGTRAAGTVRRRRRHEESVVSTRIMDEAAKVFADPKAYTDERGTACGARLICVPTPRCRGSTCRATGRSGRSPSTPTSWTIERANTLFTNSPRPVLMTAEGDEQQAAHRHQHADPHGRSAAPRGAGDRRRLVPAEGHARAEGSRRRAGQGVRRQDGRDRSANATSSRRSRSNYPLYVIMSLLGLPESDFPRMLELHPGTVRQRRRRVQRGTLEGGRRCRRCSRCSSYFTALTASRRENPTEDLASAIANAVIDGEPLSDIDTVSYYADHRHRRPRHHERDDLRRPAGA